MTPDHMATLSYESRIELAPGAEQNGLAAMLSALILQNLNDKPAKREDFAKLRGRVAIVAEDAGVALTLVFEGNMLTLHDGIVGVPDVTVRAGSDDIVQMSLVELTRFFGLPNPRGEAARQIAQKSKRGEIRVFGALLHWPLLLRLTRLLSIH
jgi:SCP-2 sterol transfer family protein